MKFRITLLAGVLLMGYNLHAQPNMKKPVAKQLESKPYDKIYKDHRLEFKLKNTQFGLNIGTCSYWGDLQSGNFTWRQSKLAGGIAIHNSLHKNWATRMTFNYGRIGGDDAKSENLDRVKRNLSFRSHIIELGLAIEYHILFTKDQAIANKKPATYYKLSPYVMGGLSVFHFNPQANYLGTWYNLQPLHTEGQTLNFANAKPYKRTQLALPFGLGLQYKHSNRLTVVAEVGFRKTFTDYLDDVSTSYPDQVLLAQTEGSLAAKLAWRSDELPGRENRKVTPGNQRGHSDNNDWYVMSMVGVRMKLNK